MGKGLITLKLRGQPVRIDPVNYRLYIKIHKPQDGKFSLNDKIRGYLAQGYKAVVDVDGKILTLNFMTPVLFREKVKSKFPDAPPWYRFWYAIPGEREEQGRLFNG